MSVIGRRAEYVSSVSRYPMPAKQPGRPGPTINTRARAELETVSGSIISSPTYKQVIFLDRLADALGYTSGKRLVAELMITDKTGLMDWNKETVSKAIEQALSRLDKQGSRLKAVIAYRERKHRP